MKNYEEYLETVKCSKYILISSSFCASSGSAWLTLSHKDKLNSDRCEVLFYNLTLEDDTNIHLSIVTDEEFGWGSVPVKGCDVVGERVGSLSLNTVLPLLPCAYKNKIAAETYLSRNPEMLISKLSNILNRQAITIGNYERDFMNLDWYLGGMYKEFSKKTKDLFDMLLGKFFKDREVFSKINQEMEEYSKEN